MVHVVRVCPGQFFHADLDGLFTGSGVHDGHGHERVRARDPRAGAPRRDSGGGSAVEAGPGREGGPVAAAILVESPAHPPETLPAEYPAVFPSHDRSSCCGRTAKGVDSGSRAWMTPTPF